MRPQLVSALSILGAAALVTPGVLRSQQAQQPQQTQQQTGQQPGAQQAPNSAGVEVGVAAPDFTLAGATRYGVLRDPVRLSDFRGKTVVVAFFPRARTKG